MSRINSRVLDCVFASVFDPGHDEWIVVKTYRDGNPIEIARFPTEEQADDFAGSEHRRELVDNGQFGVGA